MGWNNKTMDALKLWLGPSTSYKRQPHDDERFHKFIHAVWCQEERLWDESAAFETMERCARELHPDWGEDMIAEFIEKRRDQGSTILSYLQDVKGRLL